MSPCGSENRAAPHFAARTDWHQWKTSSESWSHHFVGADATLVGGETFAEGVDRLVFGFVGGEKLFVRVARRPEIKSEINIRTKGVAEETGFPVVRIRSKETGPVAGGAVHILEPFFAAGLDFVLPED